MSDEKKIIQIPIYNEVSSVPVLPPAGYWKIYPRSGNWYILNSAGTETPFGGGDVTGVGTINRMSIFTASNAIGDGPINVVPGSPVSSIEVDLGYNFGIGVVGTPTDTLHVEGTFRYVDGNQAFGKVLISDAGGVGTWQTFVSVGKYSTTFTPGAVNTPNTITHNLGSTDIVVQLWDLTLGDSILAKLDNRTSNTVDVTFTVNPAGNVRIVILAA
jgi:hypothetical protein